MLNASKTKEASELDPLVWKSFTQEFTIDPKTLHESVSLNRGSKDKEEKRSLLKPLQFYRGAITADEVHWHGTKIHFVHHTFFFFSSSQFTLSVHVLTAHLFTVSRSVSLVCKICDRGWFWFRVFTTAWFSWLAC
jgi:hypothetical protein